MSPFPPRAAGCRGCYVDATAAAPPSRSRTPAASSDELRRWSVPRRARRRRGARSSTTSSRRRLAHARSVSGSRRTLTTSGLGLDAEAAEKCRRVGQIQRPAVDGVGAAYAAARGFAPGSPCRACPPPAARGEARGGSELRGQPQLFPRVPEWRAWCASCGLNELELLRFKPVGASARGWTRS